MDDQKKSLLLFGKAIDAMEDGVYVIASSFIIEAIRLNSNFGEAYMIKALIDKVLGNPYHADLLKAITLKPALDGAVIEIYEGRLTAQNHREWQNR